MKEIERRGHPRIEIKNGKDYSLVCCDMVDEFAESLFDFSWAKDESYPFDSSEVDFVWSKRALSLIERYVTRMIKLGEEKFDDVIEIQCSRVTYF